MAHPNTPEVAAEANAPAHREGLNKDPRYAPQLPVPVAPPVKAPVEHKVPPICANCLHWQPLSMLPNFGQCMLTRKALERPAVMADLARCGAFELRPLA